MILYYPFSAELIISFIKESISSKISSSVTFSFEVSSLFSIIFSISFSTLRSAGLVFIVSPFISTFTFHSVSIFTVSQELVTSIVVQELVSSVSSSLFKSEQDVKLSVNNAIINNFFMLNFL